MKTTAQTATFTTASIIYDVIIIGAGVSGGAAAYQIKQDNPQAKILILEARDRIGGRVWTDYSQGFPMEIGAQWIHGEENNPSTKIAKKQKATLIPTTLKYDEYHGADGKILTANYLAKLNEYEKSFLKEVKRQQKDKKIPDKSIEEIWQSFKQQVPETYQRDLRVLLNSDIEQEYGGDLAQLSVKSFYLDDEFDGPDVVIKEGYAIIPTYLLENMDVQLSEPVESIDYSKENSVLVSSTKNHYLAKNVVVTVPLGVLKANTIKFTPALPEEKQVAIQKLGMGLLDKVVLKFKKSFWEDKAHWVEYHNPDNLLWTEYFSLVPYFGKEGVFVLDAFNAGTPGKDLEEKSDKEIVESVMAVLRKIFGEKAEEPEFFRVIRWAKDRYAYGSYSYWAVGSGLKDNDTLGHPVNNRLFFAGEATNGKYIGTVHGAYLSGTRVADEYKNINKNKFNIEHEIELENKECLLGQSMFAPQTQTTKHHHSHHHHAHKHHHHTKKKEKEEIKDFADESTLSANHP